MQARASEKARRLDRGFGIDFMEGSAAALPFDDASFDAVFCTIVLHYLPSDVQTAAVAEMRRVLRPGGRAIVADLDTKSRGAAMSLVGLLHGLGTSVESSPLDEAVTRLQDADFKVVTTHQTRSRAIGCAVARLAVAG
ncbi:MAG: class I SAM-dependent methyltransferase [Dehalococcoidia bacterium]|nr:class I SAM-dependent methyltransferase [Dehalococcoidia bacterium]